MRVWSASPYFGEADIAEIKIAEQAGVVERHVFLEAKRDHQGLPREPVGMDGLQHAAGVSYAAMDLDLAEPWTMEGDQRSQLWFLMPDLQPEDIVIVSDLDEILCARYIQRIQAGEWQLPAQFAFPIHPYRLDWRWSLPVEAGWCRCTAATGEQVMRWGTDGVVKGGKASTVVARDAGWHFSYQGTPEQLALKAASIADGWTARATVEDARRSIETGADLFGRDRPVEAVPLDELPVYVQENRARFRHLLRGGHDGQEVGSREGAEGAREAVRSEAGIGQRGPHTEPAG